MEPLKIHFGEQANIFVSGRHQAKAALSMDKADLSSLPASKNFLLATQKQLLELPLFMKVFGVMEEKKKLNILFLCTGNSCRSQMAEGWAVFLRSDLMESFSAGIEPCRVNDRAIKVMAESGVDISKNVSKHIDDLSGIDFDYVITLCDNANATCPRFPGSSRHIHKPFSDPSFMLGDEDVVLRQFRRVRDEIRDFVLTLPQSLEQSQKG